MPTLNDTKTSHNPRWDPAILALLEGSTRENAAAAAGINVATLYRWQKDRNFKRPGWMPAGKSSDRPWGSCNKPQIPP
jgi:hypothetical protein